MHKSTARVVGIACIVIGLARIAAGAGYLLATPLFGVETSSYPDDLLPLGMGGWTFVLTLPAAALLLVGGIVLACGRSWGRYLALAYVLFKLGLVFIGLIVGLFGIINYSDRFLGAGDGYWLAATLFRFSGILPAAFLLVLLVIPTRRRSASAGDPMGEVLPAHETARAEIVRLGWMSLIIAAVSLIMITFSVIQMQMLSLSMRPGGSTPAVARTWWSVYSMGGRALADFLLFGAGVMLLRFRHGAVPLAVVQGVLSFALLILSQYGMVVYALDRGGPAATTLLLSVITSIEANMPLFLLAAIVGLPHIRERLGRAGLTIDGQPILDESEMPPV